MGSTILELAALIRNLEKRYVPSGTQLVEGRLEMSDTDNTPRYVCPKCSAKFLGKYRMWVGGIVFSCCPECRKMVNVSEKYPDVPWEDVSEHTGAVQVPPETIEKLRERRSGAKTDGSIGETIGPEGL